MLKMEYGSVVPARARAGAPILPDGSLEHPLLLRLSGPAACNNGCRRCLADPADRAGDAVSADVAERHVVIRHREPLLDPDLARAVEGLLARGAASVSVLTNGRLLLYPARARALLSAGVSRFIVKIFGADASEHDAHTRAPGSFEQSCRGVLTVRRLGGQVFAAFPTLAVHERSAASGRQRDRCRDLALRLTGDRPVALPEPLVRAHAGEYRYDLIRRRGKLAHRFWSSAFFPMAHVNTGPACNLRCTYCNVRGGEDMRLFDREYVEQMIDLAARDARALQEGGRPTLDLIGGEPMVHPDLPRLVSRGRSAGFPFVTLCTNGVALSKPGRLDRLIDAGLTGIRFSLHDHRADVAGALAGAPRLRVYPEVAKMLLSRPELETHFFRLALRENIDALPDYLRFLAEHNRTGRPVELMLGIPSLRGRVRERPRLYPPLPILRERVRAFVALARELGIEPLLHHTPGCLLPEEPERHACLHVMTTQVDSLRGTVEVQSFEGDTRYAPACDECTGKLNGCAGIPQAFWDLDPKAAEAWVVPLRYRPETEP
jgi:MoaA/NifB/PqqE/SkfB family radical SAM enzyme